MFLLAGDELDDDACGVCVQLLVDEGACYFATAGRLVLTSVAVELAMTLSDTAFARVDCADGEPVADGCASAIGSVSFNEEIDGEPE